MPSRYRTPVFSDSDPLYCRQIALRPSLWAVVFDLLQILGRSYSWHEAEPGHASVEDVTAEIEKATDYAFWSGCIMIGELKELVLADVPDWLLRCDGAVYANVDYPELAAVIHPGLVEDEDHFRVPDRNRRLGMDGLDVGMQIGEETHTLTEAEMPSHFHIDNSTDITGLFIAPGEVPAVIASTFGATESAGGGDAHNNMQPVEGSQWYIVARFPNA